jgi:hypothetical protein
MLVFASLPGLIAFGVAEVVSDWLVKVAHATASPLVESAGLIGRSTPL